MSESELEIKHFVDLLRKSYLPSSPRHLTPEGLKLEFCASVTELHDAGVKFVAKESKSLLDIEFNNGILAIPPLELEDVTESLFRNLIVYEQCHYYFDSYIIDYIALLDFLIDTPKDVEILVRNGIIKNWLGNSKEASNLFSSLFKEIRLASSNFYYSSICRDLKEYSNKTCNRHMALLKHKDPRLHATEEHKLRYLGSFLKRNEKKCLGDYIDIVKNKEENIRQSYAENSTLTSNKFMEMVLDVSAFIIELFLRSYDSKKIEENDRIVYKPKMIVEVIRDIKIEENQLPYFILKMLYDLAIQPNELYGDQFINVVCKFFKVDYSSESELEIKHFVDLLRKSYLPSLPRNLTPEGLKLEFCTSVTELHDAGVKFLAKESKSLLDIEFNDGILAIPPLELEDATESLLRNLIVYEQCHYYFDSYIIDYIALLDFLINTPKDVEILVRDGIIKNWLENNEEASNLFSGLVKEIRLASSNFYCSSICRNLKEYSNKAYNRHTALLKSKYFNHPWAAISCVNAFVLLILTIIQVVTGIISNIQTCSKGS
ncbi:hypothetical protein Nepgr_013166 [Nepenthes gracilis]|uniref:Uncharacterized protein n=1 Tax=Nepenthes gracilis TaxID=150966 RepID=A0AAD3XP44_NEPGR|nr:hypothetical protein Nepgr_013166 [Nepenthes gracilis]